MNVTDWLRKRLYEQAGLNLGTATSLDTLWRTEWSHEFERLMRNRLIMGALRYGLLNEPGKPQYDRPAAIIKRIRLYQETGNLEYLVDVANFALLEFVEGDHDKRHFAASDDGDHVKMKD